MTDQLKEGLSALYDGETTAFEGRRVLAEVDKDETLLAAVDQYSLIGQVLRGEGHASVDLSSQILAKLDQDETEAAVPKASWVSSWFGQAAVAAGVAFAVMAGVQPLFSEDGGTNVASQAPIASPQAIQSNQFVLPAGVFSSTEEAPAPAVSAQIQADINAYLIRHAEQSAAVGSQGLLPLARVLQEDTIPTQ